MLRARLFVPAVAAAVVLVATSACASGGYYGYPGTRPSVRQVDDRAYRNGYEEGRVQGQNDAQRGRSFDYSRHNEYRNAQSGYGGYGNRNEYRNVFQEGFQAGYDEGYRRFARGGAYPSGPNVYRGTNRGPVYNGPPVYSTPRNSQAGQVGFRDGIEQGQRDARDRRPFDPVRASRYRSADRDYNSRYGSRDEYKREYRSAFEQGYQQGYGARRY
jgi:hypothetical protein